jgi:hypothetical protein
VVLKSWQRGVRRNCPYQSHLSVALQAPHHSTTPSQSEALREMIKLVLDRTSKDKQFSGGVGTLLRTDLPRSQIPFSAS